MQLSNSLTSDRAPRSSTSSPRPALFEGEGALVGLGFLGLLLSAICGVIYLIHGPQIGLEGQLSKPIRFDLALGLFLFNMAAVLPLAGFSPRARKLYRWSLFGMSLYAYAIETGAILLGRDPRFSQQTRSIVEAIPSILFGVVSLALVLLFALLLVQFCRSRVAARPELILGTQYGLAATMVASFAGLWMIMIQGHQVGAAGSAEWIHFFGFEGFKVMLLTAWLAERSGLGRRWVHVAGLAWLVVCGAVWWQAALGLSLLALSPAVVVGALGLALYGWATLAVMRRPVAAA